MMTDHHLKILELIGSWLSGVGTLSAVITSLWLARRQGQVRLTVSTKHVQVLTPGKNARPDYLNIKVVNVGIRPVKIVAVGWISGRFKEKQHIAQLFGDPNSNQIPAMLNEGEEINLMVPFKADDPKYDWITAFPKLALLPNPHKKIRTLRLIIYTSVGTNFKTKPDRRLRLRLLQAAESLIA